MYYTILRLAYTTLFQYIQYWPALYNIYNTGLHYITIYTISLYTILACTILPILAYWNSGQRPIYAQFIDPLLVKQQRVPHCRTALHWSTLHCTALHCTVLKCTALHRTAAKTPMCTSLLWGGENIPYDSFGHSLVWFIIVLLKGRLQSILVVFTTKAWPRTPVKKITKHLVVAPPLPPPTVLVVTTIKNIYKIPKVVKKNY